MTTFVHSSQQRRYSPLPKTVGGRSRADEKAERDAADEAEWRGTCILVDARDLGRCRVCGRRVSPTSLAAKDRAERHHIVKRSQGGSHDTSNVVTLCKSGCHDDLHVKGVLRVSGDADLRDEQGRLCGVLVQRVRDEVWLTVGMV